MKIKPEERPTAIGLGIATAVMFTIGIIRLAPQFTGGDKTATTQNTTSDASGTQAANPGLPAVSTQAGAATGTPTANRVPGSKTDMYNDATVEPATTRDPFTPAMPGIDSLDAQRSAPPITRVRPVSPSVTVLPMRPNFPFPGRTAPTPNSVTPATDEKSQASQVILAGVIAGPQAVAVIHIGDRAYPLVPGEKMPFNMSLGSITEEGAYVKQGKQMWFVQVGKSLSAATPIKSGMKGFAAPDSMAPAAPSRFVRRVADAQSGQTLDTDTGGLSAVPEGASNAAGQTRP